MAWSPSEGVGYQLINENVVQGELAADQTTFTFTGNIHPGRNYLLKIQAVGSDGSLSEPAVAMHTTPGVDEYNNNTAADPDPSYEATATSITLTWPNVENNSGYAVFLDREYQSDSPTLPDQNFYEATGLQPSTWYMVEVRTSVTDGDPSRRVPLLVKTTSG